MHSKNLTIASHGNTQLAAILDLPLGTPRAYIVLVHCFGCHKQQRGLRQIASELCAAGFALLRFDLSAHGQSEGQFMDNSLTKNVADIQSCAQFLAANYQAPQVIIGHSFGALAAIKAAQNLPDLQALVCLNAPADTQFLEKRYADKLTTIQAEGFAAIEMFGAKWLIGKTFVNELNDLDMACALAAIKLPILFLQAQDDALLQAMSAKELANHSHNASVLMLPAGGHMLHPLAASRQAAHLINAWLGTWLVAVADTSDVVCVALKNNARAAYSARMHAGGHYWYADEPIELGGANLGATPIQQLLTALGACTAITLKMYAGRKNWAFEQIEVQLTQHKMAATDVIERRIIISGDLDAQQRERMLAIANRCPVHRLLSQQLQINSQMGE